MIKVVVKIDRDSDIPNWAKNFLMQYDLLSILQVMKKSRRTNGTDMLFQDPKYEFAKKQLYANSKGELVFFWPTKYEQSIFLFRWM